MKVLPRILTALCTAWLLTAAGAALADIRVTIDDPDAPDVTFSTTPRWFRLSGSPVYVLRGSDRPQADMFRYGSTYYMYEGDNWYRARSWRGPFVSMESDQVPMAIFDVPRGYWNAYPSDWDYPSQSTVEPPDLPFTRNPPWVRVGGTDVYMVRANQRPAFDLFRYQDTYYVYENGRWFRATHWDGPYALMSTQFVPWSLFQVPRGRWHDYPPEFAARREGRYGEVRVYR